MTMANKSVRQSEFSPDGMRARFRELGEEKDAVLKDLAPLQKRRDGLASKLAAIEEDIRPVNDELKAAKAPLAQIDNEMGALARALGGKTGE